MKNKISLFRKLIADFTGANVREVYRIQQLMAVLHRDQLYALGREHEAIRAGDHESEALWKAKGEEICNRLDLEVRYPLREITGELNPSDKKDEKNKKTRTHC